MGWKNLFNKHPRQGSEAKASHSAPLMVQFGGLQPRFTPRQYDQLAKEGYQKNVIAYRCIRLISQNAAAVPWVVYKGRGAKRVRLEDHALVSLLTQPNPMQGGAELFAAIYGFYLIAGNGYIEAVAAGDNLPRELWTLRPDRMRVIPGRQGLPAAYRYQVGGSAVDFAVDAVNGASNILHLKAFHPLDDWYGMSPLEAAAASIDQHNDAGAWNAALLQSSGRPSGALIYNPPQGDVQAALTDEQRQSLKTELEHFFSGKHNAGRPLVLEGGLDWREMSLSPKDMDWLAGKEVSAREIALAFHVPPQLVGIEGSLSFANFEQARLALFDDAVLPMLDHVKDELNHWLAPRFGDDIQIDYDVDKIEAFATRREKVWQRINNAHFMTINEKRAALGMPAIDGGDRLAAGDTA